MSDENLKKWLKIGVVGRAHGLQGSFFVSSRDEAIPDSIKSIRIGKDISTAREFKVTQRTWQNNRPTLRCDGIVDRTAAEKLCGASVWAEESAVPVADAEEYLWSDVRGRTVIGSDDVVIGVIEDVYQPAQSVNLVIVSPDGKRDVEIPMTRDYIDMSFVRGGHELRLMVPANTFEEVWNVRGGGK